MAILNATDVDSPATFMPQTNVTGSNGYGKVHHRRGWHLTTSWTTHTTSLSEARDYTDSPPVATADGTTQVLTVTMHGTNDAAVITGSSTARAGTETNAAESTGGDPNATDVDSPATFMPQNQRDRQQRLRQVHHRRDGTWTYLMDNAHDEFVGGQDYTDSSLSPPQTAPPRC